MRKLLLFILLLAVQSAVKGQTGYKLLYWFNNDKECNNVSFQENGNYKLDISHLNLGIHSIHIMIEDSAGIMSTPVSKEFFKIAPEGNDIVFDYWFDNNEVEKKTFTATDSIWNYEMSVKNLTNGLHTFHVQTINSKGYRSSVEAKYFFKIPVGELSTTCSYWFDENDSEKRTVTVTDSIWKCDIDVKKLDIGLHRINIQATDNRGYSSPTIVKNFIKTAQGPRETVCTFWFDRDYENAQMATCSGNEVIWLDVSELDNGFHTLYMQAEENTITSFAAYHFMKIAQEDYVEKLNCDIFIDGKLYHQEAIEAQYNGIIELNLDITSLTEGEHTMQIEITNTDGVVLEKSNHIFEYLGITTNIIDVESNENDATVYDINGIKVNRIGKKGIYIINNKKVYINVE